MGLFRVSLTRFIREMVSCQSRRDAANVGWAVHLDDLSPCATETMLADVLIVKGCPDGKGVHVQVEVKQTTARYLWSVTSDVLYMANQTYE